MSRRPLRFLPSLAALAVVAAIPATASATFPGADGAIAFVRDGDIWTINADGTGRQQVTTNPARDHTPRWSPDGQVIAFTRVEEAGPAIYVVRPGGAPTRVVADAENPAWSPDGRRIAFTRGGELTEYGTYPSTIRIVNRDGSGDRRVLYSEIGQDGLDWSPDGGELLYNSYYEDSTDLRRVNVDGTNDRSVAGLPSRDYVTDTVIDPSWSPDGARILYARNRAVDNECPNIESLDSCYQFDVAVVNRNGSLNARVLKALGSSEFDPVFSPSGGRIAFSSNLSGTRQIWVMSPEGNSLRQVTTSAGGGSQPDWQPLPPPRPAPSVTSLAPAFRTAGSGSVDVVVAGSGFTTDSVVRWNGADRPTTRLDAGRLRVTIAAADLATPGFAQVTVFTPAPGGGQAGPLAFEVRPAAPAARAAPQSTAAPRIDGSPVEGAALTCQPGSWSASPSAFAWQWLRGGAPIAGATGPSYATTALDAGVALTCRVTASNGGGASAALSAPVVVVAGREAAPAAVATTPPPAATITTGVPPVATTSRPPLRLRLGLPLTVRAGATVTLRLRFSRAVAGMPVQVQRRRGGAWTTLLTRSVAGRSPVVRVTLRAPGTTVLRVRYGRGASAKVTGARGIAVVPR